MDIERTSTDEYILIPHMARLKAIAALEEAGIDYQVLGADDIPDNLPQIITFRGKQFAFPKVQCIKASVNAVKFVTELEK